MIKFLDILREAKQVGPLYHFTSYGRMILIVKDNLVLKPKILASESDYLSFTRNKQMISDSISRNVRITVDGDKLSEKYKIEPYADTRAGYGRNTWDESEERISMIRYPNGVDISNMIKSIDILNIISSLEGDGYNREDWGEEIEPASLRHYNDLIKLLKEKNIPYNIVKKY